MRVLTVILLALTLFFSCKKDKKTTTEHHGKININLHPFLFNDNSYWIYKDSISGTIDSTIVTSIHRGSFSIAPNSSGQGPQGDEECFKISYKSFPNNNNFSEELFASSISRGNISGGVTYIATKSIGTRIQNASIEYIYDSLIVEGHTYFNVVKMRVQADAYISSNYNLYYVDSIGIIKKDLRIGEIVSNTWNLLRYNTNVIDY